MGTFDAETAWFLDRGLGRVVTVTGGACSDPDLRPEQVEDDEARFAEIPAVTRGDEHDWLEDFVEAQDNPRLARMLDDRQGAVERFVKRLTPHHTDALAAWHAFRAARLRETAAAWLAARLGE